MKGLTFLLLALAIFFPRAVLGSIDITLLSAPEGPVTHGYINLNTYIQSSALIESVSAEVGSHKVALERTSGSENNGNYVSTWVRSFFLPDFPDGPTNLIITVHAAGGETAVTNRPIIIASPPTLIVSKPFDGLVLHSGMRLPIKVAAFDEDSDVVITVVAGFSFARTNEVDIILPVPSSRTVRITAEGNHNQITQTNISYIVQENPKFQAVDDVPGIILDVDSSRILYQRDLKTLRVKTIGDTSDGPVVYQSTNEWIIRNGLLTPHGAILVEELRNSGTYRVFDVGEDFTVNSLGPTRSPNTQVAGNYAVWQGLNGELFRRDLLTGTNLEITNTLSRLAFTPFSVVENGEVTFSAGDKPQVYRYRSGSLEQISTNGGYSNWTDGTNVLYYREHENNPDGTTLVLHTPGGAVILSRILRAPTFLNKGWVAFVLASSGYHIWTRSPSGALQERAAGGTTLALNSIGEVIYRQNQKFLSRPDGSTVDLGIMDGRPIYRNDQWHFILNNTLFRALDSFTNRMVIHQNGGILNVRFIGTTGNTYQIETAPNLTAPVVWTPYRPAQKADINGSIGFYDLGPETNRFYRTIQIQP
jgi:hypothetical protein